MDTPNPENQSAGTGGTTTAPSQPSSETGTSSPMESITNTINSAIELLKNPAAVMTKNKDSKPTTNEIMINYVAILALIPLVGSLIGGLWFRSVGYAVVTAVLGYIFAIVSVFVVSYVIKMLAPTFASVADQVKSMKLAAYLYTPVFLAGIFNIIPFLGLLVLIGVLYGLYILYLGLPIELNTPKDRVVTYFIAILVVTFIIYFVIAAIIAAVTAAIVFATFV